MRDYEPEGPTPTLLTGASRYVVSFALLAVTLAMTIGMYGGWLSGAAEDAFRFGLPLVLGAAVLAVGAPERSRAFRPLLLSLFGVSLGFALAHLMAGQPLAWFGLSWATPQGAAVDKVLTEVLPICAAVLLATFLAGGNLRTIGLLGGRAGRSLVLGLLSAVPLVVIFPFDPSGGARAVVETSVPTLLSWLPWILVFSIANGFMEELWFRGSWSASFRAALGPAAAMHVTSVVFCVAHVIVYWRQPASMLLLAPVWLYMGYAYAVIVRKTGSVWGPVLSHAIANVLYMYAYFALG
jgi:membrane protease YdiL (CAAX protease family)